MNDNNTNETTYEPKPLCFECGDEYDTFGELKTINGADGRDPRHFCPDCFHKIMASL